MEDYNGKCTSKCDPKFRVSELWYGEDTCCILNIEIKRMLICDIEYCFNNGYRVIDFSEIEIPRYSELYQIEIKRKKSRTIAILKDESGKYIKHTEARCHPEDGYDFEIGKQIALQRLFDLDSSSEEENRFALAAIDGIIEALNNTKEQIIQKQ